MKIVVTICSVFIATLSFAQETNLPKLTFEEAVKVGLKKNITLNQQKNQLMVSQAQKLNSIGNFLPNLNITGSYQNQAGQQQNTTSGDLEDLSTDYLGGQFNANFTVFNGFRNLNTLAQANKQLMTQGYLIKRSTQDVVYTVATQYLQVLLDQELMRIADENQKIQRALKDQMQGFFDVGTRAATDVYNQDALMKAAEVNYIQAKNTLQNDKALLSQTLQLDPSQSFEVIYPVLKDEWKIYQTMSLDSLIKVAVANRPDLKQANYQADANKFAMRSASANYMPNVSLFANYGSFYYSQISEGFNTQFRTLNPSTSYGANLTIPIFSRFQTRAQHITAQVTYQNSILTKENLEKTVRIDVQRSLNNLTNAIEGYNLSISQFQAGELALQTQKESYELGISTQVALAQANQTYVNGASSKAQAEVTLLFQKVLLDYALGVLQIEDYTKEQ